ncbi:MAG: hypothetical protein WBQ94_15315 [Terracidiphilus sp.]
MILGPCPHEKEVAELLRIGHYPQACPPELRAHIAACRSCADLALVTQTFQAARANLASSVNLTAPGMLWWRAQLRRRNAAVERIGKPILHAHIFALTVSFVFAIGFLATQATHGLRWLPWLQQLPQASALHLEALWPSALFNSGWSLPVLLPLIATLVLLSSVVVYLASEKQ